MERELNVDLVSSTLDFLIKLEILRLSLRGRGIGVGFFFGF